MQPCLEGRKDRCSLVLKGEKTGAVFSRESTRQEEEDKEEEAEEDEFIHKRGVIPNEMRPAR